MFKAIPRVFEVAAYPTRTHMWRLFTINAASMRRPTDFAIKSHVAAMAASAMSMIFVAPAFAAGCLSIASPQQGGITTDSATFVNACRNRVGYQYCIVNSEPNGSFSCNAQKFGAGWIEAGGKDGFSLYGAGIPAKVKWVECEAQNTDDIPVPRAPHYEPIKQEVDATCTIPNANKPKVAAPSSPANDLFASALGKTPEQLAQERQQLESSTAKAQQLAGQSDFGQVLLGVFLGSYVGARTGNGELGANIAQLAGVQDEAALNIIRQGSGVGIARSPSGTESNIGGVNGSNCEAMKQQIEAQYDGNITALIQQANNARGTADQLAKTCQMQMASLQREQAIVNWGRTCMPQKYAWAMNQYTQDAAAAKATCNSSKTFGN